MLLLELMTAATQMVPPKEYGVGGPARYDKKQILELYHVGVTCPYGRPDLSRKMIFFTSTTRDHGLT